MGRGGRAAGRGGGGRRGGGEGSNVLSLLHALAIMFYCL